MEEYVSISKLEDAKKLLMEVLFTINLSEYGELQEKINNFLNKTE